MSNLCLLPAETFWRDRYNFSVIKSISFDHVIIPIGKPPGGLIPKPFRSLMKMAYFRALLDATTADGRVVFIKRVNNITHPNEVKIALCLGSPESQQESGNHCVPILEIFPDEDPKYQSIVMPVLRPFDDPNFTTFGEVIDFVNQTLEGLAYMHAKNIAHRDCAAENILMDGSHIYKDGWHPMQPYRARDGGRLPFGRMRSEVPIKYYFIDFGLSTRFPPDQSDCLVVGNAGRVQAPEQPTGVMYDPFKYDVYVIGTVYKTKIVDNFKGLEPLGGMVQLMTKRDPKDRPTVAETKKLWDSLQKLLPPRYTRLRTTKEEDTVTHIVNTTLDVVGRVRDTMGLY